MDGNRIRKSCAYCGGPVFIKNDRELAFCNDMCEREYRENMRKIKGGI